MRHEELSRRIMGDIHKAIEAEVDRRRRIAMYHAYYNAAGLVTNPIERASIAKAALVIPQTGVAADIVAWLEHAVEQGQKARLAAAILQSKLPHHALTAQDVAYLQRMERDGGR